MHFNKIRKTNKWKLVNKIEQTLKWQKQNEKAADVETKDIVRKNWSRKQSTAERIFDQIQTAKNDKLKKN